MPDPSAPIPRQRRPETELAADLNNAGFFITSSDLLKGHCTIEWALDHVQRTIPKRNARGQEEARAVLEKWANPGKAGGR